MQTNTGCSLNIVFFSEDFKMGFLYVFPRCQCVYTHQAGRTLALQQNWQSSKKSQNFWKKNTIFNEHPVCPIGKYICSLTTTSSSKNTTRHFLGQIHLVCNVRDEIVKTETKIVQLFISIFYFFFLYRVLCFIVDEAEETNTTLQT